MGVCLRARVRMTQLWRIILSVCGDLRLRILITWLTGSILVNIIVLLVKVLRVMLVVRANMVRGLVVWDGRWRLLLLNFYGKGPVVLRRS